MNNIVDLAEKRPSVHYTINIEHKWDGSLSIFVHDLEEDERNKKALAWTLYCSALSFGFNHVEQPVQEPVGYIVPDYQEVMRLRDGHTLMAQEKTDLHKVAVYTHPAPSWQGLTAKEIASIPLNEYTVQTVERMLKEKNHG